MEVNLSIAPENGRMLCGHLSRSFEGLLLFLLDDNELLLVKTSHFPHVATSDCRVYKYRALARDGILPPELFLRMRQWLEYRLHPCATQKLGHYLLLSCPNAC